MLESGQHSVIGHDVQMGKNVRIGHYCVIEDGVSLGDDVFIDNNVIIRSGVTLGNGSFVGANCVLGEYQMDFIQDRVPRAHALTIGDKAVIRSGSVIYSDSTIGACFQTGHHATIREQSVIGSHVSVGTLSDVQGHCTLGDYVRLHSDVFIPMTTRIGDCVWIFPHAVLTSDPTPPSERETGPRIHSFAIIAAHSTILPGVTIHQDALIGAGAVVTRDVQRYEVVIGNPARVRGDVRELRNRDTGEPHYPWRYHFRRAMPWEKDGFEDWYAGLDEEAKAKFFGNP